MTTPAYLSQPFHSKTAVARLWLFALLALTIFASAPQVNPTAHHQSLINYDNPSSLTTFRDGVVLKQQRQQDDGPDGDSGAPPIPASHATLLIAATFDMDVCPERNLFFVPLAPQFSYPVLRAPPTL